MSSAAQRLATTARAPAAMKGRHESGRAVLPVDAAAARVARRQRHERRPSGAATGSRGPASTPSSSARAARAGPRALGTCCSVARARRSGAPGTGWSGWRFNAPSVAWSPSRTVLRGVAEQPRHRPRLVVGTRQRPQLASHRRRTRSARACGFAGAFPAWPRRRTDRQHPRSSCSSAALRRRTVRTDAEGTYDTTCVLEQPATRRRSQHLEGHAMQGRVRADEERATCG